MELLGINELVAHTAVLGLAGSATTALLHKAVCIGVKAANSMANLDVIVLQSLESH